MVEFGDSGVFILDVQDESSNNEEQLVAKTYKTDKEWMVKAPCMPAMIPPQYMEDTCFVVADGSGQDISKAKIGDMRRFPSKKHLSAYAGVVLITNNSGECMH